MKKRVVLIGGGQIVTHYKEGLEASPIFEVVALCDLDEACPARALFPNLPFYKDFQKAIEELGPGGEKRKGRVKEKTATEVAVFILQADIRYSTNGKSYRRRR